VGELREEKGGTDRSVETLCDRVSPPIAAIGAQWILWEQAVFEDKSVFGRAGKEGH
jgi:hypothetical protein